MFKFLSKLLCPGSRESSPADILSADRRAAFSDDAFDWLLPPQNVHDAAAWDRYWSDQIAHGVDPAFSELFANVGLTDSVMRQAGLQTILCIGNGMSREPHALAAAGFDVTVLDLSPLAARLMQSWQMPAGETFGFFDKSLLRAGGRLRFVVGDLIDPGVCPGPFDVIIERRTLQLFSDEERPGLWRR